MIDLFNLNTHRRVWKTISVVGWLQTGSFTLPRDPRPAHVHTQPRSTWAAVSAGWGSCLSIGWGWKGLSATGALPVSLCARRPEGPPSNQAWHLPGSSRSPRRWPGPKRSVLGWTASAAKGWRLWKWRNASTGDRLASSGQGTWVSTSAGLAEWDSP